MKKKLYLILGSFLLLLLYVSFSGKRQRENSVAASILTEKKQETMTEMLDFSKDLDFHLLFSEEKVPYDETADTYYLPQTTEAEWLWTASITVSEKGMSLYWCADPYWDKMEEAISEGHAFAFVVSDGTFGEYGKIVFTGLPMMHLERLQEEEEDYFYCKVTVFDPFHSSNEIYEITKCFGYLGLRGHTSKSFPKKGWDLNLVEDHGKTYETSLFGLRKDDEWKLNALYPDASKVRESLAMELWNELAAQTESPYDAGTRLEYFELVTDQDFQGIYGAMEKIDFKQLSLGKTEDVIYKGYAWPDDEYVEEGTVYGHKIKTGDRPVTEELWRPFLEYVEVAGFLHLEDGCDTQAFYNYILEHMDLDNFLNSELFVQTLYAFDNQYKNFYVAADLREDGDYTLWKIPWDLNYSFGDRYSNETDSLTAYRLEWAEDLMDGFLLSETLLEGRQTEFVEQLNEKWQELRNGIFSVEHVRKLAEERMKQLTVSGAYQRDQERWPEGPHDQSLDPILEFHSARLNYLDEHYASYLNEK